MDLLHPGVYIQEIPSGVRPIEGVSTSTGAFIGKAQMGPLNQAVLITRASEFESKFGTFLDDSWLAHDVVQFFNNGGQRCYIVRVAGAGARAAELVVKDRKGAATGTMAIRASSPGGWGNGINVTITDGTVDPDNEFNLSVFQDRSGLNPPLPPELLENFEGLSMDPGSANHVEKVIAAKGRFITVAVNSANLVTAGAGTSRGGKLPVGNGADVLKLGTANGGTETAGAAGPPATAGRSRSGDNPSTNPPADRRKFNINLNGDGIREVTIASDAATGPDIAASIQATVQAFTANDALRQPAYAGFVCTYKTPPAPAQPFYELLSGTAGTGSTVVVTNAVVPGATAAALLGLGTSHGGTETAGAAGPPPTSGESRSASNPVTSLPADNRKININLDKDGPREITIPTTAGTGADIAAAIQGAVQGLTAITAANQPAYANFTSTFETPASPAPAFYRLRSGTTGPNSSVVVTDDLTLLTGISLGPETRRFNIDINHDGPHVVNLVGPLANGTAIAAAIQTAVRGITPNRSTNAAAFTGFNCIYDNGPGPRNPSLLLTSGTSGANSSVQVSNSSSLADNAAALLHLGTTNGGVEVTGQAVLRPANSQTPTEYYLGSATATPGGNVVTARLGSDGLPPGDLEHKNGLTVLDSVRDVNLIAIPGIGTQDVVSTGVNYCTRRADCFFIGDMNSTDVILEDARAFINGLTVKSSFGAVYYPWLKIADPTGQFSSPILVPPSGAVMGMYAQIDSRRGVWKAPAGTEANLGTALGLAADTTDAQQDFLNPIGVNVIRSFPASGIVIWGARTLATRSDPEYRYIPVRRTAIFLEQSIYNGIQFAVFEPNDEPLWASLRLNITAFMTLQFRAGAFQGSTANQAFFVKCDSSTTTQQDIDAGIVNILVGFAPLKPAEFVVLKLTQKSGQPA
jgi:phage tail sheath protein FI